jgi:hypothetical protein
MESDRSMYVYQKGSTYIIIPIFIDDITIACKNQSDIDDLVAQLRKHFELCDIEICLLSCKLCFVTSHRT